MTTPPNRYTCKSAAVLAVASLLLLTACGDDQPMASPTDSPTPEETETETPEPDEETEEPEPEDPDLPSDEDLEAYVVAMGSSDPNDVREAESLVVPGSPAEAYLRHIEHLHEADRDAGFSSNDTARVTKVDEGFELCWPGEDECVGVFQNFAGDEGLIYTFSIDDRAMDDVIVMGDGSVIEGPEGSEIEFVTAYENAVGTHLIVSYILRTGSTPLMAPFGSYRSPSGRQSQSEVTNGAWELSPDSMSHYTDFIPGGEIGGEMHLEIIDAEGYTQSTVTVPTDLD